MVKARGPEVHTRGKAWPTATKPSHVPSQGPQCIFFGENDSSRKPQQLSLPSFVIVSFRAFPHGDQTLPEVNVLLNQSAAAAGNKIPPPPRLVGSSLLPPFHDSRRAFSFFFLFSPLAGQSSAPSVHSGCVAPEGSATSPRGEAREKLSRKGERALPARGGMCKASERRGTASGEVLPVPLCGVGTRKPGGPRCGGSTLFDLRDLF